MKEEENKMKFEKNWINNCGEILTVWGNSEEEIEDFFNGFYDEEDCWEVLPNEEAKFYLKK